MGPGPGTLLGGLCVAFLTCSSAVPFHSTHCCRHSPSNSVHWWPWSRPYWFPSYLLRSMHTWILECPVNMSGTLFSQWLLLEMLFFVSRWLCNYILPSFRPLLKSDLP
jgi:hypothetical protein